MSQSAELKGRETQAEAVEGNDQVDQVDQVDWGLVLLTCADAHWVLQGEPHLSALIEGQAGYPTPVLRVCLHDMDAVLDLLTPLGVTPAALWAVHPNIVARLRQAGELRDITPADAATIVTGNAGERGTQDRRP